MVIEPALTGPAATPRQVKSMTIRVDLVHPGMLRLSQPAIPGWVGVARTPVELARLVAAAFTEAQVAAYSLWRGDPYEGLDGTRYRRPRPARRGHRVDVHDPREWRVAPDGRWVAPGSGRSRLWSPESQVVARVKARRVRLGLPAVPDRVTSESDMG